MTTTWEITALSRLESELEADANLSAYVDVVEVWHEDDPTWLPTDMQRHGIALIPESMPSASELASEANLERLRVRIKLFVAIWDPTDRSACLIGTSTTGGVGASEVGILQFAADVRNALRLNELSGLVEATAVEADEGGAIATRTTADRGDAFKETTLIWTGEYQAAHVRS